MNDAVFEVKDISKRYTLGGQTLQILRGVDLSIRKGEMVGIVGASGAGKSTLLHIMGLLDRPDSGWVYFNGKEINFNARFKNARIRNRSRSASRVSNLISGLMN